MVRSLGVRRASIYPWLRRHKKNGSEALPMRKAGGPKPKLDGKQRRQVRRWIIRFHALLVHGVITKVQL